MRRARAVASVVGALGVVVAVAGPASAEEVAVSTDRWSYASYTRSSDVFMVQGVAQGKWAAGWLKGKNSNGNINVWSLRVSDGIKKQIVVLKKGTAAVLWVCTRETEFGADENCTYDNFTA